MLASAKSFFLSEDGASLIEYSLLIGLISAAIVIAISAISGNIATIWSTAASVMVSAA